MLATLHLTYLPYRTHVCTELYARHASQGVLLPGLGIFAIGPVLEDRFQETKRIRPAFGLLEARFNGVAQERGKWALASEWRQRWIDSLLLCLVSF